MEINWETVVEADDCGSYQRRDGTFHPDVGLFLFRFLCIIVKVQSHEVNSLMSDIHEQLRALLDREGASYRVIEHEPEGRTEMIAKIRGNRIEQSIKSIVVQVRLNRKENIYCLVNVPGDCRVDLRGVQQHFYD